MTSLKAQLKEQYGYIFSDELIEEIEEREMPLASYTWTHKEAQLTDAQVQSLVDWARNVRSGYSLHTNHD